MSSIVRLVIGTLIVVFALHGQAAEIGVRLANAPQDGIIVLQVYDNANAFGDFRNPAVEARYPIQSDGNYRLREVPAGTIAVLAYVDENDNGTLDKNFIGIPKEPLGLSNNYRPKGPPSFQRASVLVGNDKILNLDIELYSVLGKAGQWGLGVGVIGRSNPYVNADSSVLKAIPAITYIGKRVQLVGPELRYGIAGTDNLRLALTASYRIGVYEENDSLALAGLGDRDSTLLAGLGLVYQGPAGTELDVRYEHDSLDRIGGGTATAKLSRSFQTGYVRLAPKVGVNWLSKDLGNHDFGVPNSAATPGRPEYSVDSSMSLEAGITGFIELAENWSVVFSLSAEFLDNTVTDSPIVDDDRVMKGFAAISYTF